MVFLCLERKFLVSVRCFSLILLKSDLALLSAFILLSGGARGFNSSPTYAMFVILLLNLLSLLSLVEFLQLICSGVWKHLLQNKSSKVYVTLYE